jgi:hypothetical protein
MTRTKARAAQRTHVLAAVFGLVLAPALLAGACTDQLEGEAVGPTLVVDVTRVNGGEPPTIDAPLPANIGTVNELWEATIEAVDSNGKTIDFNGDVRISVQPGAVVSVRRDDGEQVGRNVQLRDGKATVLVEVTAVYGEARLWVEDVGYVPAPAGETPACANGKNDDPSDDVLVDFPNDPGCAFADDDTEEGGTFSAGVSETVHYELPSVRDIQGGSSTTPYRFEAIEVNTSGEHVLIVTRVSKDGFYATDLADQSRGHNHLYAFNFSTPRGMRVCDRVTYVAGTVNEFFGMTGLNFPSYDVEPLFEGDEDDCLVPEPEVLTPEMIADPNAMERLEAGLVRVEGYHVSAYLGPELATNNVFGESKSNCDFNGDGRIDFTNEAEGSCGDACSRDPECSEWTAYLSRGNYKVAKTEGNSASVIIVQTEGAPEFNPMAHRGDDITAITGTMKNFSGGSLNWTIEARCTDDVVCAYTGCSETILGPKEACVDLRTIDDNDEGSN